MVLCRMYFLDAEGIPSSAGILLSIEVLDQLPSNWSGERASCNELEEDEGGKAFEDFSNALGIAWANIRHVEAEGVKTGQPIQHSAQLRIVLMLDGDVAKQRDIVNASEKKSQQQVHWEHILDPKAILTVEDNGGFLMDQLAGEQQRKLPRRKCVRQP